MSATTSGRSRATQGVLGSSVGTRPPNSGSPRTAALLQEILSADPRCRRKWQRYARRIGPTEPNQAGVARVLAESLYQRGEVSGGNVDVPRSLKDRVSRALTGALISMHTLALFVTAFELTEEQEESLYAALDEDRAG